jgi:holo-[acyl-carrier protein] synthase
VLKAVGTGLRRSMRWTDVEIVRGAGGRPRAQLHGEVAEQARRRRIGDVQISIAHSDGFAIAQAIALDERGEDALPSD